MPWSTVHCDLQCCITMQKLPIPHVRHITSGRERRKMVLATCQFSHTSQLHPLPTQRRAWSSCQWSMPAGTWWQVKHSRSSKCSRRSSMHSCRDADSQSVDRPGRCECIPPVGFCGAVGCREWNNTKRHAVLEVSCRINYFCLWLVVL